MLIIKKFLFLLVLMFCLSSCVSSPLIQPQVNNLVVAEQYDYALEMIEKNQKNYGPRNELLFFLDYGAVLHYAGRYEESIAAFEKAKRKYDALYTRSLSNEAATWLVNDKMAIYRGEDFERVMINIFQALNYAAIGNIEEALVEARDVDRQLELINRQYRDNQKNKYREDAFARLLMGILYEAEGHPDSLDDARISYQKAEAAYNSDYYKNAGLAKPHILSENFSDTQRGREDKAQIYLIFYGGISPIKHQFQLPIPLPGGFIGKLAFPYYEQSEFISNEGTFKMVGSNNQSVSAKLELVEDIGYLAQTALDDRKARVIAKAILRQGAKYMAQQAGAEAIDRQYGQSAGYAFRYLSSLYNITSEDADLRSWQTLPNDIKLAKLTVEPGEYTVFYNEIPIGQMIVQSGDKRFFIYRKTDE
jgi:uncharacterized protein